MKFTALIGLIAIIYLFSFGEALSPNNTFVMRPGIIRSQVVASVMNVNIPRGGAILQPATTLNNTGALPFSLVIKGQACDVNDPLVLMFRPLNSTTGAPAIVMTLPSAFFYITSCGDPVTTIDLSLRARWALGFLWDGQRFVADTDVCPP